MYIEMVSHRYEPVGVALVYWILRMPYHTLHKRALEVRVCVNVCA